MNFERNFTVKHQASTTLLASLQWLFFIFANTFIVPISIGAAFHLSAEDITATMRISFILTGTACVLQGWVGHRFSLMEGHSGLWWGLILALAASAPSVGISYAALGGGLATGILLAGFVTLLLGLFNLVHLIQRLFTPVVMGAYLLLLSVQLSLIFFKGMLKVNENGVLDVPVTLLSILVVIAVTWVNIKGKGIISNFAILIGIVIGWISYVILFGANKIEHVPFTYVALFPLGIPNLEIGIVLTGFVAGMLNLSNNFTSIYAAEILYQEKITMTRIRIAFTLTGVFNCIAPVFGLVPYATYTSSIGFLESSRIFDRKPFLIGGALLILFGIITPLGSFLATMPVTIGNAVLFVAYIQMFGTAIKSLKEFQFHSRSIYRMAFPVLIGVCIMNLSPNLFSDLPMYIRPLISNGLLMGILLAIFLDKAIKWSNVPTDKT